MGKREMGILNNSMYSNYKEELIKSCGVDIALSIYESDLNDPCVIFLAGTMTHPLFYDEFLTKISENGFNVIGIHTVSHGKSPRVKKKYTFEEMKKNVKDAISFCILEYNDNIILMGSSQGGILSISVSAEDERVKAVFPHNILLTDMRESISVTSIPQIFKYVYKIIPFGMKIGSFLFPKLKIPITAYLKLNRIFTVKSTQDRFYLDPIGLTKYPLIFLSSLFSADLSNITDGDIKCPVHVIASKRDTLFPFDYCMKVYDRIKAPSKDMILFDEPHHLILNECVDVVINDIVNKLNNYKKTQA